MTQPKGAARSRGLLRGRRRRVAQEGPKEELTLLVADGNRQEGDEGHDRQQTEEHADEEEELEALQPGPPEVLQVHDASDEGPERQHP